MFNQRRGWARSPDGCYWKEMLSKEPSKGTSSSSGMAEKISQDKYTFLLCMLRHIWLRKNHKLFNKRKRIYMWKCIMYITDVKYVCTHRQTYIYMCCEIFIYKLSHFDHILESISVFLLSLCSNTPEARVKCHDCHTMGAEILEPAPNPSHRRHFQCLGGHDGSCRCFWKPDYDRQWTIHRNVVT